MYPLALSVTTFVIFTLYTVTVALNHSIFGFLADHARGGWSLQIFLDLVVAACCFWVVAIPDARARGIKYWPYVLLTPFLGSIALLGYFVHRSLLESRKGPHGTHGGEAQGSPQ